MTEVNKSRTQLLEELTAAQQKISNLEQVITSLNEDVTERKRAEQAAKQTEQKYKTLVEQLPAITYTLDYTKPNNRTTYISPQVETLLGFSTEEWLSSDQMWTKQIHPEDRIKVFTEVKEKDDRGEGIDIEYRILSREGNLKWFRNQTKIIKEDGVPKYAQGIMFDITQQKLLEFRLRQIQRMEAVGQMAGGMAHNFNNLLTSLIGHTELALYTLEQDHSARPNLVSIRKSAIRAAELTKQLLAFTRHQDSKPTTLNLSELLAEIGPILRQLATSEIDFQIGPGPDLWSIKADPNQIEQVLVNLIVNARDAIKTHGKITIETTNVTLTETITTAQQEIPPANYVLLSIADTGSGIPKDVQPHIFEPFFTTKEVGQGTGLGLSTCFGIVQQSKGFITVTSEPEQGTTFNLYFPQTQSPIDYKRAAPNLISTAKPPLTTGTVLLVDDAFMVRKMSARVLIAQGYRVLEASDGKDALDLFDEIETLSLLITDMSMPHISGDELAYLALKQFPTAKVLFISGHSDRVLADRGVQGLEHGILTKPFTPQLLLQAVEELLT